MPDRPWRDEEEDWSETDDEDEDLANDRDGDDAFPCPECGAEIDTDFDRCPRCGYWLSDADRNPPRVGLFDSRTTRIVAAVLLAIFALSLLASILAL